ncbi:MAG: hypothetical protein JW771_07610 [Candidatus Thermoplasmatota archaeon]|nr:hypothetical protein [Candidatus Thermoplasmatota archaeon]
MTRRKSLATLFLFSLVMYVIFSSMLLSAVLFEGGGILNRPSYILLVLICIAMLSLCLYAVHALLTGIRLRLKEGKEKEQSVKECYQYEQLLNPPVMNN